MPSNNAKTSKTPERANAGNNFVQLAKLYGGIIDADLSTSNVTPRNKALIYLLKSLPFGLVGLAYVKADWYIHVLYVVTVLSIALLTARDHRNGKYKNEAEP